MKKALAGFFVFAAYLQLHGVVAAERDRPATEVAMGSECVEVHHGHPHHPESSDEDGRNDQIMKDAEERARKDAQKQLIDGVVKGVVKDAIERR
jgi:hypothetical protein